jgi:succinate dehydrogenase/fumarate reductase flavoprotein subunit
VVIVGGGLAGISAALEFDIFINYYCNEVKLFKILFRALKTGASVVLVDKEANLGGNSAKASSGILANFETTRFDFLGINGCDTPIQEKLGISDSPMLFYSDTFAAGDRENDPVLVDILVINKINIKILLN